MILRALRRVLRRVLGIVVVGLVLTTSLVALPFVTVGQLIACIGVLFGRRVRVRALRILAFAIVYTLGEIACMLACLALWLSAPIPSRRDAHRWEARHVAVLTALLDVLVKAAELLFAFRLRLDSPRDVGRPGDGPRIVLARHAGPGASFVLVHVLLRRRGLVPRIVLKEKLRLDPALDMLLTRIGCAFVGRDRTGKAAIEAIGRLAAGLGPRDALVLFPEGSDWTPTRHRLAVRRLRLRGLRREADAAEAMPNVLPPRPAGTFAALSAAPGAALSVFMHAGHDHLLDAQSVWDELPLRRELHMIWWNEPRPAVAGMDDVARWLNEVWQEIDAWIGEQGDLHTLLGDRWHALLSAARTAVRRPTARPPGARSRRGSRPA